MAKGASRRPATAGNRAPAVKRRPAAAIAEKAAKKKKERNDRLLVSRMGKAEKRMQAVDQIKKDVKEADGEATKALPQAEDEGRISSLEDRVRTLSKAFKNFEVTQKDIDRKPGILLERHVVFESA